MFTLNGGVAKKNKQIPTSENVEKNHVKVLTNNPFENLFYPLKLLGIFVFFGGLSYLLFSKSDTMRSYLGNIISQAKLDLGFDTTNQKNSVNREKAEKAEKAETNEINVNNKEVDEKKTRDTEKVTSDEPSKKLDSVNKKLAVLEDYVETTKSAPPKKAPEPETPQNSNNVKGFCLVGEERGRRECIEVENSDECMSGDIFTTENQCVNPNMRYDH